MDNVINLSGEIYVLISYLEKYGVNTQTIHNGLARNRKSKTEYYVHFQDSINSKRVWIKYLTLTPDLFRRFKLPNHEELVQMESESTITKTKKFIQTRLEFAYEYGYKLFMKHYIGTYYGREIITSYARTHCLFSSCLEMKQYNIEIKDIFKVYLEYQDLQFQTENLKSFYNKLKLYEVQGHRIFIHKSYGESRGARKLTAKHISKIEELYKDKRQLSGRDIHLKINQWAIENGYSKVSLSTIKKVLADAHLQNRCKPYRNGEAWKKNLFDPFTLRIRPQDNGTLWEIDGSKLQIPYLNDGKPSFLNYFVVMDVHSGKIIGYSLDKSENAHMVLNAMEMAVFNCNYLPLEILMDHGSSFTHNKFKSFEEQISLFGTQVRKHLPGNAKDKGHIERFVSTFQTTICKNVEGYIGEGVKSKQEEGRPDENQIHNFLKPKNLRSRQELESLFGELIEEYNNLKINDKKSPNTKYEIAKLDKYASNVSKNDMALMFWHRISDYQIKNSMVLITEGSFRKNTFQYVIEEDEWRLKLNFTKILVCYTKEDRSFIKLFDENENHILDVKRRLPTPMVIRKPKESIIKDNVSIGEEIIEPKLKSKNQLYKKPETLDVFFVKTKHNE